ELVEEGGDGDEVLAGAAGLLAPRRRRDHGCRPLAALGAREAPELDGELFSQPVQGTGAVLMLRAGLDRPRRQAAETVAEPDRAVGLVSLLSSGTRGAEAIDVAVGEELGVRLQQPPIALEEHGQFGDEGSPRWVPGWSSTSTASSSPAFHTV